MVHGVICCKHHPALICFLYVSCYPWSPISRKNKPPLGFPVSKSSLSPSFSTDSSLPSSKAWSPTDSGRSFPLPSIAPESPLPSPPHRFSILLLLTRPWRTLVALAHLPRLATQLCLLRFVCPHLHMRAWLSVHIRCGGCHPGLLIFQKGGCTLSFVCTHIFIAMLLNTVQIYKTKEHGHKQ